MAWSNNGVSVLEAVTVIISAGTPSSGLFVYSGTPAFGNLVASIAATSGTDAFGNTYVDGIVAYTGSLNPDAVLRNGALSFGRASANFAGASKVLAGLTLGGDLQINSGVGDSDHVDALRAAWTSGRAGQTTGSAFAPSMSMIDAALSSAVDQLLSGSVIKTTLAGVPFTWQTPAYNTNWLTSSTFNGNVNYHGLQYRLDSQNNVHIIGTFKAGATAPVNPVFNLPVGYRPTSSQGVWAQRNNAGTVTSGHIYVGSSGDVMVITGSGLGIAANNEYIMSGVYPLNNIP